MKPQCRFDQNGLWTHHEAWFSVHGALLATGKQFIELFDTSRMINGGETRPVIIAVSFYLDVLNLFMAPLQILGALQGGGRGR